METKKILIAIVDDHTLFRSGVAALMGEFAELTVVFEASNGQVLQQMLPNHPLPQVILMDINMPVMDGYATTKWLKEKYPEIKVLALSMFDDDKAVIGMIQCGAVGYVLKESKPKELLEAIKIIQATGKYINEMVSSKLMRSVMGKEEIPGFTDKEVEFLKLCCSELTYKEIADMLCVSPRTVENYRESLFQKLSVRTRTGLVMYAMQSDLFKL